MSEMTAAQRAAEAAALARYGDIIGLPAHVSAKHPHMSTYDRAAQFAPFAALTGYDACIKEAGRLTEDAVEVNDTLADELDRKFAELEARLQERPEVHLTLFIPDERKAGGRFEERTVQVRLIEPVERVLVTDRGEEIPLDWVVDVSF